jgi:flavin reductase (DIM6/NTAB) family NADH-FMN oxidoreductase RutF
MTAKIAVPERHWDAMFAPSSVLAVVTSVDSAGNVNAATYGTCTRVAHNPVYLLFALTAVPASEHLPQHPGDGPVRGEPGPVRGPPP